MAELAASERLNYLSKKQRAVSSRHSRQIISANNGNIFRPEQFVTIPIPGMQAATYLDFQNSYLRFTVKNTGAQTKTVVSGYDLIQQIELLADGVTLSNIQNYNVLVDQYMASEVGANWKDNIGRSTVKYASDPYGTYPTDTSDVKLEPLALAQNASEVICLPLVLTPLFSVNKYIPLVGRSTLTLRITFASGQRAFKCSGDEELVEYSPVEFIASQVRLSADANQLVMQNTRGVFELICSDYRNAQGFVDYKDASSLAFTTGFSFSSFDRLSFSFYPHSTLNDRNKFSIRNRARAGLTQFALAINGEEFPKKRIEISATNSAEAVSELCLAHRSLSDFNHQSAITTETYLANQPDGSDFESLGTFVAMLDLEAMQPHLGDSLYSGMTTTGSTVQMILKLTPNGGTTSIPMTCHMFANFTSALVLDMNGSQAWSMSL